jgi:hypothetical protein
MRNGSSPPKGGGEEVLSHPRHPIKNQIISYLNAKATGSTACQSLARSTLTWTLYAINDDGCLSDGA